MSNQFLMLFAYLLIILNIHKTNQLIFGIPEESSFIPLNSRQIVKFELTPQQSEIYYSFQNEYKDSDIIINLKVGKGFTSKCYIYDSYEKIETNSQGEYIHHLAELSLTEKTLLLKNTEYLISKTKYYIIIKDIVNSYNKDYISIFNEKDIIELESEKYISIEKYYSQNAYYFHFSHKKDEVVSIELNTDDVDFYEYIAIYYEDNNEFIYIGEKNNGEITINEDFDEEGSFILKIESEEEPYLDVKSSIIFHRDTKKVKGLNTNNPITLTYNENKVFNFYVDVDEYDYGDENIITFKFGNQMFNRNLLSHCFGKVMNFESFDDNKILANMPANEDENESIFEKLSGTSDTYQLYFKKTVKKEENKKAYLLVHLSIKLEEHDTNEYISPEEFTVYLSDKPKTINLEEYKNKNLNLKENIELKYYTPQIYKILLPRNIDDNVKLSYIFYTSESIQTIFNNTMLSLDSHIFENSKMIYSISPSNAGYDYTKALYIKFYGFTNKDVNFRIESTESLIYYINNDYRKIRTFSDKLTDCSKTIYYIGNYGLLVEKGYLYQETLYGKINTYYRSRIDSSDETILINENSKYLIENNLLSLDESIDIVELKCELPSFYQVHLIDNVDKRDINLYSKIYNYLPKNTNFTITPILSPTEEDINLEITSPNGNEVKISDGEKIETINSNNKFYHLKNKSYSEIPKSFTVLSTEDALISITLTNKEPFVIVEKGNTHIDYDSQIIVKLAQNKNYESINIVLTRIYHGYSYSLFKGNVEYASKLIESEFDYVTIDRSHKINMTVSNPYLRNEEESSDNNAYYIMYSIDDPEMIQKDVILTYNEIKNYESIDIGKSKSILNELEKYSLPFGKDVNSINIVYLSCANSLKEIGIYNLNDRINTIINGKIEPVYQHAKVEKMYNDNNRIGIDFKLNSKDNAPYLNGAIIGITNQDITDDDINKYSNMKKNITQKGKNIEWEKFENNEKYDVFILDENNTYSQYLNNPCLLQSIKNNPTNLYFINDNSYIKYYSLETNSITMEVKGKYNVVVSVNVEGKVPLVYIYDKILYDSSLVPPDDDGEDDDDNGGKGTTIFLAIALPAVIIVVLILLFVLIRAKKNSTIDLQEPKAPIIRETTRSTQNE